MNADTKADVQHVTGTSVQIENEALMERLQAFGLIESNGEGGWVLTECCRAGLAGLDSEAQELPKIQPHVIRPWMVSEVKLESRVALD
jgi:hypothetical protein